MKHLLACVPILLCAAGCGDPIPPPRELHLVNLTDPQRRAADSLEPVLMQRFLAVPDTFVNTPQGLRVTFLHAPFASWSEPGCHATVASIIPAQPVARVIWEAMSAGTGLRRLTLVTRSEPREYGNWFNSVSCGSGADEYSFYPRDFAASPTRAD